MKMSLSMLLLSLRDRILTSIEADDRKTLSELHITPTILREESYASQDDAFISLVVALEDVARDGVMGMALKQELPSAEQIRQACDQ